MFKLISIFLLISSLISSPLLGARENYINNSSFNKSCSYFLSKIAPEDFQINTPDKERTPAFFTKDVIEVFIEDDIENIWKKYINLDFEKILKTSLSDVCKVYYPSTQPHQKLTLGMRAFINMNLKSPVPFPPSQKSMTALEVTKILEKEKIIEISYLEGTPSKGWQTIELDAQGKNKTKLIHTAYYKGNNELIHRFYSPVHRAIWNEIHNKAKN